MQHIQYFCYNINGGYMITISIDGYLTEDKLRKSLQKIIGIENWIGNEVRVLKTLKRWDMMFKYNNQIYIVEFDGDQHFRDSLVIKSDDFKDQIAKDLNYIVIHIPYFIQLTNESFKYYFNFIKEEINIIQNYKHGFIDKKAKFPASFCELGKEKYNQIFTLCPHNIKQEILFSLQEKAKEFEHKYVY